MKTRTAPKTVSPATGRPLPAHHEIAAVAHTLWNKRGCPSGRDEEIWLEAELQLRRPQLSDRDKAGRISDAESYPGSNLRDNDLMSELDERFPDGRGRATTSL